ncbi:hypothetical protein SUDANB95_06174 [Actinosynnema sp. ALI-1.44]
MFKKAAAATAITAALMAIGSPAFANDDIDVTEQVGLVNFEETDIVEQLNVCDIYIIGVEVNVVPIESPTCENEDVDVEIDG